MKIKVKFTEEKEKFDVAFSNVVKLPDGGYERGYEEGYVDGSSKLHQFVDGTLTSYSNDELKTVREYLFFKCTQLEEINLPNCIDIDNYAFQYCSSLKEINFPNVVSLGASYSYAFSRCTNLSTADFGAIENIGGYAFQLCNNLLKLIIRTPKLCTLTGVSAINSSGIHNKAGAGIYVPDQLVEDYKNATNWSNYASKIKPLSELGE